MPWMTTILRKYREGNRPKEQWFKDVSRLLSNIIPGDDSIKVTYDADHIAIQVDRANIGADEKVKGSSSDPTAGYLDEKVQYSIVVVGNKLQLSGDDAGGAWKFYGELASGGKGFQQFDECMAHQIRINEDLGTFQTREVTWRAPLISIGPWGSIATTGDSVDPIPDPIEPDDPTITSGQLVWLKADADVYEDAGTDTAEDGDKVYQWNDQSGNNTHATQSNSEYRPAYDADSQNSLPAVDCDGYNDGLSFGDAIEPTKFTIYMALRIDSITTTQAIFRKEDSFGTYTSYGVLVTSTGKLQLVVMDQSQGSYPVWQGNGLATGPQIIDITFEASAFDSTDATLYRNGATMSPSFTANSYASGFSIEYSSEPAVLGFRSDGAQPFLGAIYEFIVYGSKHSDATRAGVRQYLSDKWDIGLS